MYVQICVTETQGKYYVHCCTMCVCVCWTRSPLLYDVDIVDACKNVNAYLRACVYTYVSECCVTYMYYTHVSFMFVLLQYCRHSTQCESAHN